MCGDKSIISKPLSQFELCQKGSEVCDIETGDCVKNDYVHAPNKLTLDIDGNLFVGNEETITKIKKIKGNIVIAQGVSTSPPKKSQEYKKTLNDAISKILKKGEDLKLSPQDEKLRIEIIDSEIKKLIPKKTKNQQKITPSLNISQKLKETKEHKIWELKYPTESERVFALKDYLSTL